MASSPSDRIEWAVDRGGSPSGVRVLDLSRILVGPCLTMLPGDPDRAIPQATRAALRLSAAPVTYHLPPPALPNRAATPEVPAK